MKNIKKSFLFFIYLINFQFCYSQEKINDYIKYKQKKEESLIKKDTAKAIYYFYQMAKIEKDLGLNAESEQTAIRALNLQNKIKNKSCEVSLNNLLGMNNRALKNYDNALFYYKKLKGLVKKDYEKMALYNNLGIIFLYQKKYDEAIIEFKRGLDLSYKLKDSLKIAKSLDNLGFTQSKLELNEEGYFNMIKALSVRKKIDTLPVFYPSYMHLFEFYSDRNDTLRALEYVNKSYNLAKKIKNPGHRLNALSNFVKLKQSNYFFEYNNLRDSIEAVEEEKKRQFISVKYNYYEQEKLAKEEELKREKAESLKIIYQIIGLFVILLSIAIYFFYREKYKKKVIEQVIATEGKISKTIHDVIANDVYQVMAKFQSNLSTKEELLDDLEKVYDSARDISRDNYIIDEIMNYEEILHDLFSSYKNEEVTVVTKNLQKINWTKFSVQKKNMMYRVAKEIMTNMRKYSEANLVTIGFEQKNKIHISYKDNGVGSVLSKKNGLLNAENRIKSVGGKIIFNSEPGKGFTIKIIV